MVAELHADQPTGARDPEWCTQAGFAYRFDWGPTGFARSRRCRTSS